eukprot:comp18282_c0_seq1/m.19301 comp18282_c0_seq1/g.19301  ORF comp18282_c0_seq1/g.19301 comp18282_c0_seq1/m.19301 type:complete len:173 (-) comp18282_c0_seq1:1172-1690(-)
MENGNLESAGDHAGGSNTRPVVFEWRDDFWVPQTASAFVKRGGTVQEEEFSAKTCKWVVPLKKTGEKNTFAGTIDLPPGTYQYLFLLNDKTWKHMESKPCTVLATGKVVNYVTVGRGEEDEALNIEEFTDDMFDENSALMDEISPEAKFAEGKGRQEEEEKQSKCCECCTIL